MPRLFQGRPMPKTILIADDSPTVRKFLREMVKTQGRHRSSGPRLTGGVALGCAFRRPAHLSSVAVKHDCSERDRRRPWPLLGLWLSSEASYGARPTGGKSE